MSHKILLFALLFLLINCPFFAFQSQAQTVLHGRVLDEQQQPIPQLSVLLLPQNQLQSTDSSGQFWFDDLPVGACTLSIQLIGYQLSEKIIFIPPNKPHFDVEMQLLPLSAQLQIINVEDLAVKSLSQAQLASQFFLDNLAGNFSQSLANLAGVQAINTGVGIAKPVIRGLTGNRVLVLNDGIKQESQQWGNDHGLEIDAFDTENTQIVKGAAALQYGADAIAGVIILNPLKIPPARTVRASLLSLYKSNNAHAGFSTQTAARRKRLFAQFRASYQQYGDYQIPADSFIYNGYVLPIYAQRLKNTAGKELNLRFTAGWLAARGISRLSGTLYQLHAGIFTGAVGIPRSYSLQSDNNLQNIAVPAQKVQHAKLNFHHFSVLNQHNQLTVDAGWQQNHRRELSYSDRHNRPPNGNRNLALDLALNTLSLDFNIKNNSQKYSLLYGLQTQYQQNQAQGFEFLIPSYQAAKIAAFILSEYSPALRHLLTLGLRIDANGYVAYPFGQQVYNLQNQIINIQRAAGSAQNYLNYASSLGWVFSPRLYQKIRANIAKTYRPPALNELTSDGIHHGTFRHERGNLNLNPEQGYQSDFSVEFHPEGLIRHFAAACYANYFQNFIFLRPSGQFSTLPEGGQLYKYTQAAVFHTGFELEWSVQPHKSLVWHQNIEYVYNYNLNTGLSLPFTPPLNLYSALKFSPLLLFKPKTHFNTNNNQAEATFTLTHLYAAAQNLTDRNELATPAYHLLHIAANLNLPFIINKKQKARIHTLKVSVQIQNVLNTPYLQHLSRYRLLNLPEQGRNIILSLLYEL